MHGENNMNTTTTPGQGRTDQNTATGSTAHPTHPLHPDPMSSDPNVDNITGAGDKPQYDAGEEP